jgi:hypothetical protein
MNKIPSKEILQAPSVLTAIAAKKLEEEVNEEDLQMQEPENEEKAIAILEQYTEKKSEYET